MPFAVIVPPSTVRLPARISTPVFTAVIVVSLSVVAAGPAMYRPKPVSASLSAGVVSFATIVAFVIAIEEAAEQLPFA